jgi:glyoxylase-like metal-dependent hydrolase (beta-lactamase superfamily II)
LLAAVPLVTAQSKLRLQVITASPEGFWVTSTLIYGENDAVLIDAQFTLSDAHRLAAAILESRKNLTTIYVTHSHPDHYFGLSVLKQAFPNARIVALPATIADIEKTWAGKVKQWQPLYGNNIPGNPIVPEPLTGTTLTLEGETLQIAGDVQGDDAHNSYVWIPSLKAVVCGDIVYSGVYLWTLETTPARRKDWIKALDRISALNPTIVVAGHKNPDLKDDVSTLQFSKNYLAHYDEALAASKTAEEFRAKINSKFPNLGLDIILKLAVDAAFATARAN